MRRRWAIIIGAVIALAIYLPAQITWAKGVSSVKVDAPAGTYTLDKAHGSMIFRVEHMGFSHFTGHMSRFDVTLQFDPAHPTKSQVDATIDPTSLESDNPPAHFLDMLHGPDWLDAAKYPTITFHSTKIVRTGPKTARVTGDFTLHGETHPVVLNATFNGGYPGMSLDPHARIGFSLRGHFKRSAFGMGAWVPKPGTTFGVGDDIEVIIEAELSGPAWVPPKAESKE